MPINLQNAKKGCKKRINVTIRHECKKRHYLRIFTKMGGGRSTEFPKQMFVNYSPINPLKHHKITKKKSAKTRNPKRGSEKGGGGPPFEKNSQ